MAETITFFAPLGPICEYRVQHIGGCVLIIGQVPLSAIAALAQLCDDEGAVLDPRVARMADVNFAFGTPEKLQALEPHLVTAARQRMSTRYSGRDLPEGAVEWLATGECGTSSMSILQYLTGVQVLEHGEKIDHPYDVSDVSRCRKLLMAVPALELVFWRMSEASHAWKQLMAVWRTICDTMDAEAPNWLQGEGSCPKTNAVIAAAIKGL